MTMQRIDLAAYRTPGVPVYTGRRRGENVRDAVELEKIDETPDVQVEIVVPEDTWLIASSFFLGLLGPSIRRFGEDGFRSRFTFTGPVQEEVLDDIVQEALNYKSPLASRS